MAIRAEGKPKGKGVARMSDYGVRAAMALNQLLPGEHRDKTVARMFNVSVRMAKYLRTGQHWTIDRLSQASAVLGASFDVLLSPSTDAQHYAEMADIQEIAERLARLEERVDAGMVGTPAAGLAPQKSASASAAGRVYAEHGPAAARARPASRASSEESAAPAIHSQAAVADRETVRGQR